MTPKQARELIENTGENEPTYLGTRTSNMGVEERIELSDSDRVMHTAVIGPTGQGKTNFLLSLALQDARKSGFAFLNPKGSVISEVIAKLPQARLEDVIYINPNEARCPAINLLKPEIPDEMTPAERDNQHKIIVSSMMAMFRRLTDEWGERWPRNLRSLLSAHVALNIHAGEQNTLLDIYNCVIDDQELIDLINRTPDKITRNQLEGIKDLSHREREPLKRRLSDIVENQAVRKVIAQPETDISFRNALAEQKIILVDAQGGRIGDWAAGIIGSVVLTRLWNATAARSVLAPDQSPIFHVLIDEIPEFVSEADHIRRMLSQCREFNVSITAATQYLSDLDTTMQRALLNNTLTKVVFSPGASKDLNTYATIMNGLSKDQLAKLGKYRPAIQLPAEKSLPEAAIVDTFPPWDWDMETADKRKQRILNQYEPLEASADQIDVSLGSGRNAGGERHTRLLTRVEEWFEERDGVQVQLFYQGVGSDQPDGEVQLPNGDTAHIEAENASVETKPGKVLKNLHRAAIQGRETIFVVEAGNASKLETILSDPVNRRGDSHQDEHGTFDYYKLNGERFTAVDELREADYRILEVDNDSVTEYTEGTEPECPKLGEIPRQDLEKACIYRDGETGVCELLEQRCVLTHQ